MVAWRLHIAKQGEIRRATVCGGDCNAFTQAYIQTTRLAPQDFWSSTSANSVTSWDYWLNIANIAGNRISISGVFCTDQNFTACCGICA